MRILLVVHRALPHSIGGVELWADALARGLSGLSQEVGVLALGDPGSSPLFVLRREPTEWGTAFWLTHRLSAARSYRDTWQDPRFREPLDQVFDSFCPDVVHLAHPDGWGVWPLRKGQTRGVVTAATLHDYKWICGRGQMVRPPGERCLHIDEDRCTRCISDQLSVGPGRTLLRRLAPESLRQRIRAADEGNDPTRRAEPGERARRRWRNRQRGLLAALRDADLVISPSRFVSERLRAAGLDRPVAVIPNGLDGPPAVSAPAAPGPIRIGFFGNPHRTKGLETLVQAVGSRPAGSVHLFIYGAGEADLQQAGVINRNAPQLITAMGAYPAGSAVEHMQGVDLVVIPSTWDENHPIVAVEARLAGKPLLVSDRGGLPELVREAVDGWVLPAGDPAALGERIGLLAANRSLLRRVSSQVRPPPSAREMAAAHIRAYEECQIGQSLDCAGPQPGNSLPASSPR